MKSAIGKGEIRESVNHGNTLMAENSTFQDAPSFWQRPVRMLREFFMKAEPILDMPYTNREIGALYKTVTKDDDGCIDDQTWKDLDLSTYSENLSHQTSIFSQQAIHLRLRQTIDANEFQIAQGRYRFLMGDEALRLTLQKLFIPLRKLNIEVTELVFEKVEFTSPWWLKIIGPYQILIIIAVGALLTSVVGWVALFILICVLILIQASWQSKVERLERSLETLRAMLSVAKELAVFAQSSGYLLISEFTGELTNIDRVSRGITRSLFETAIPGVSLYSDWFLLANIRQHFKALNSIKENQPFLQRCYRLIGDLEADVAIARNFSGDKRVCWASRNAHKVVSMTNVVNPLLANAVPASIKLNARGVFLSGQNSSGKSTMLRTLGINLVIGRALGFCYATEATVPICPVYTSIHIEDSMSGGESLYIAELRRARELLESSQSPHSGTYIIDEIFRGTNHVESVSAAAAVIHSIAQNALVIVSSHNLVLSAILKKWLTPLCVKPHTTEQNSMIILNGVLDSPNGIALLTATGFNNKISENATRVFSWLGSYLAHPIKSPDILQD
jgi:hypothetical protein